MSTTHRTPAPCRHSTMQGYQCQVCAWAPFQSDRDEDTFRPKTFGE